MEAMKRILITGSTDGIGLATAKMLLKSGHRVIVHGRNDAKVERVQSELNKMYLSADVSGVVGDLSSLKQVHEMADNIKSKFENIDVLINNAGVFKVAKSITTEGHELRFVVNTIAPYLLSKLLLPIITPGGRIVNLASAAQAPVDVSIITKARHISDGDAYHQSKLALIMWTMEMAKDVKAGSSGIQVVSVNPKSFLGSKMVKEAYGSEVHSINIGADILCRAALSEEFADSNGKYFDNDVGRFAKPHRFSLSEDNRKKLIKAMEEIL